MVVKDISSLSIDDVIFTIYDWIVAKTFSDHPDFEMDGHKGLLPPPNCFGWSQKKKKFQHHPNTEMDTKSDAGHKRFFTHEGLLYMAQGIHESLRSEGSDWLTSTKPNRDSDSL